MTGRPSNLAVLALASLGLLRPSASAQEPFRGTADAVILDVSVRLNGHPVPGLTGDDFQVVDNGVPQHLSAASTESLPIDVTFVVDTSAEAEVHQRVAPFVNRIREITALLRAGDRARMLADSVEVIQVTPSMPIPQGGGTSTYDAFVTALMQPPAAGRRGLVIAFTEGIDYFSVTSRTMVPEVARRADVLLHVVTAPIYRLGVSNGVGRGALTVSAGTNPLVVAARATGGDAHALAGDVVAGIKEILDDFRASYLLYYSPQGVQRTGWHDLGVTMAKPGKYEVRARKGYVGG